MRSLICSRELCAGPMWFCPIRQSCISLFTRGVAVPRPSYAPQAIDRSSTARIACNAHKIYGSAKACKLIRPSMSSDGHKPVIERQMSDSREIPSRTVVLKDPSELPSCYSTTPGGTLYSTTPGGNIRAGECGRGLLSMQTRCKQLVIAVYHFVCVSFSVNKIV